MRKVVLLMLIAALTASCGQRGSEKNGADPASGKKFPAGAQSGTGDAPDPGTEVTSGTAVTSGTQLQSGSPVPSGAVLIATDIVTEVVVRPDPEGDPWEVEKVAGYRGDTMVESIFNRIYDGTMTVYDYHSGEPLTTADVKKIEGEFKNDRTKIGKLSFTEDWYWFPTENRIEKKAKSVTFGYELYNNLGKVYAYRAAFRADLQ